MPDLVTGLGGSVGFGEGILGRNDDESTAAIDIRSVFGAGGINYFGVNYTTLFVNNNGNITFGGPLDQYIAAPIGGGGLTRPIIAAYWFDIDTRGGVDNPSPGGTSTGSNLVYFDLDPTNRIFTATWDDVGYYNTHIGSPNAFQIRLIDVGNGDFDIEFIYEVINQSASDTNVDPGEAPRAGYSPANGTGVEIAGSGDYAQMLLLDTNPGNTGVPGYYTFQVRDGQVMGGGGGGGGGQPPPPPLTPVNRLSFSVEGPGLAREGDTGTTPFDFTVTRFGNDLSSGATVDWVIELDDPNDLSPAQSLTGTAFFGPGQTRVTVDIDVAGDRIFEMDEMVTFRLVSATYGDEVWDPMVEGASIIVNDDSPVTFSFAGPRSTAEGLVGDAPVEFVVMRTGDLTAASTVQWSLEPGAADSLDFAANQPLSGVITFAIGATQAVISIQVAGDVRFEPDEDFTVNLTSATTRGSTNMLSVSTIGTILDDDARQSLLVASPPSLVLPEGNAGTTSFTFTLMRIGELGEAQVPYLITLPSNAGASAGEILTPLSGVVGFGAGASQATFTVLVQGDSTPEGNETFLVRLGGGTLNTLSLTGVIMNDDKLPGVTVFPEPPLSAPIADTSSFMLQLAGGGLWSDAGAV